MREDGNLIIKRVPSEPIVTPRSKRFFYQIIKTDKY